MMRCGWKEDDSGVVESRSHRLWRQKLLGSEPKVSLISKYGGGLELHHQRRLERERERERDRDTDTDRDRDRDRERQTEREREAIPAPPEYPKMINDIDIVSISG